MNAIGHIRKLSTIDGKKFDHKDRFCYQTVELDTQVLLIDDAKKRFPFDDLYSIITQDFTVEKKGKDAIRIPFSESPKLAITTNYSISSRAGSSIRRKEEVVLGPHYGISRTPEDDFNRRFFDGWDPEEFNRFDNFMLECVQYYLRNGIVGEVNSEALDRKKLRDATSAEFIEYMEVQELGDKIDKKDLYNKFINSYPHDTKFLRQNTFTKWVREYLHYNQVEYIEKANNGVYYFFLDGSCPSDTDEQELPF